jgi:hypothetical protein
MNIVFYYLLRVAEVAEVANVTFDPARPASSDPQADYGRSGSRLTKSA